MNGAVVCWTGLQDEQDFIRTFHNILCLIPPSGGDGYAGRGFLNYCKTLVTVFAMYFFIALFCIASYLLGSFPTGLVLARVCARRDIREAGSGNIGATNVARILGVRLGACTFLGDMLKGFLPVFAGSALFQSQMPAVPLRTAVCLWGLAAFLGHVFPVYLRFKGGKGVATGFGVFLYLAPLAAGISLAVFIIAVAGWRYVSLGSLCAAAVMPLVLVLLSFFRQVTPQVIMLSMVMGLLIVFKHRANIKRLWGGTESRLGNKH